MTTMAETPAPAEALSREQLEALRGHTPAPWAWRGHPAHRDSVPKHPYLRSEISPRYIVMDFVRQGMQGAQPRFIHRGTGAGIMRPVSEMGAGWAAHPDARLIAAAPDLLTTALAALARAEAAETQLRLANARLRRVTEIAGYCEQNMRDYRTDWEHHIKRGTTGDGLGQYARAGMESSDYAATMLREALALTPESLKWHEARWRAEDARAAARPAQMESAPNSSSDALRWATNGRG